VVAGGSDGPRLRRGQEGREQDDGQRQQSL